MGGYTQDALENDTWPPTASVLLSSGLLFWKAPRGGDMNTNGVAIKSVLEEEN